MLVLILMLAIIASAAKESLFDCSLSMTSSMTVFMLLLGYCHST